MANKRISQLPYVGNTGYTPTDIMPIVNYDVTSGTTKHTPILDFKSFILSGITDNYVTGATYSNGVLTIQQQSGNISVSGFTQPFTGNTSGDCINDLYISNLHGCSPITIHDSVQYTGSTALGVLSVAEGNQTIAYGDYSHSEGNFTYTNGPSSHVEGVNTYSSGYGSHSEGYRTESYNYYTHAEGVRTTASGYGTHSEGRQTTSSGYYTHSEGRQTTASGFYTHSEGRQTTASEYGTHSEGRFSTSSGYYTHAEGSGSSASGYASHAEGNSTVSGYYSHSEGIGTLAGVGFVFTGDYLPSKNSGNHAEGLFTSASGGNSHTEGYGTLATGYGSHAEGGYWNDTTTPVIGGTANGDGSHAEGIKTITYGIGSHTEGYGTVTDGDYQHAQGMWNVTGDTTQGAFIIGNGLDENSRSNLIFAAGNEVNISGKTITTNFQMTSGATNGYVLTSDASGNASWQVSTGGGGGTFTYEIGEYVPSEGGVIVHRWFSTTALGSPTAGTVQNYLVVDTNNLSTSATWGLSGIDVTNCESTWDGQTNTNSIISAGAAAGTAAVLCDNSTNNGKSDWYLPAVDELNIILNNRFSISQGITTATGTQLGFFTYWSSTEDNPVSSYLLAFGNFYPIAYTTKASSYYVRAVRKFSI